MTRRGRPRHPDILTPREWEVLACLRAGRSNEEIATALGVTLATARFHVSEIISKLGVTNRHEAAAWRPEPTPELRESAWEFAPFAAVRNIKWNTAGAAFGAAATVAALAVVALLIWGVTRTFPASSGNAAAICTPGPTLTPSPTRPPNQPPAINTPGLRPDSTRQAEIEAGQQRNLEWTNRFIAAGCDPHALPDFAQQYDGAGVGYGNPDQVVAGADLIVSAHVDATNFTASRDRQSVEQSAHSSVTVLKRLKGNAPETLVLGQYKGPIRQPYWGALYHFDGLPLLLTGDDVILFLQHRPSSGATAGAYFPLNYVGTYYVRGGRVYAGQGNPCEWAIDGTPEEQFVNFIQDTIVRTSSGQISSAPSCGDFSGGASSTPEPTRTPRP